MSTRYSSPEDKGYLGIIKKRSYRLSFGQSEGKCIYIPYDIVQDFIKHENTDATMDEKEKQLKGSQIILCWKKLGSLRLL